MHFVAYLWGHILSLLQYFIGPTDQLWFSVGAEYTLAPESKDHWEPFWTWLSPVPSSLACFKDTYSWPLNNTGLNCLGPLLCRFFFSQVWIENTILEGCKVLVYRGQNFYILGFLRADAGNLSIHDGFWYMQGSWKQLPVSAEGRLYKKLHCKKIAGFAF